MADRAHGMESAVPAKRPRLDFPDDTSSLQHDSDFQYFAGTSELLSGGYSNGGEFTITSDSGFNELTPPQSMEDEITTPRISTSQEETNGRLENQFENQFVDENTNDSSANGCVDTWPAGAPNEQEEEDEEDRRSVGSTASNLSGLSDFSNFSGKDWKPCAGPMSWVQQQMLRGVDPRIVLGQILGSTREIPMGVADGTLWRLIVNMLSEPPRREKLRHINTIEDVVRLMKACKKIIVLTGAGVSVSCGIPDFRSRDGIYARLAVDFPDLPDPQAMFDINYFRRDPRPFFKFAREIYPGLFTPSLCHRFIRLIEQQNKLLRNYTQNIDTLEQLAGIKNVIQCHGSFATATCQTCGHKVDADVIKEDIFAQRIPHCPTCTENRVPSPAADRTTTNEQQQGDETSSSRTEASSIEYAQQRQTDPQHLNPKPIMKPDIVFFGEGLPDEFHDKMAEDKDECDLLIVIGSSLKVRPVALIPSSVPSHVPQILINREPLRHLTFDVELLGDCDVIINELCHRLGGGWDKLSQSQPLTEIRELPPRPIPGIIVNNSNGEETSASPGPSLIAPQHAPHPRDESDIEALRACWAPKIRETMASRLPEDTFLYAGTHKYIFQGAEVYYDPDDEYEDNKSVSSDTDSDLDPEESRVETGEESQEAGEESQDGDESRLEAADDSQESFHSNHTPAASFHHPRLEEFDSTNAPHLSPDDVVSLLSTADNGQSHEHIEDWTSLNASLDTSLDCDHTLPAYDTDTQPIVDSTVKMPDFGTHLDADTTVKVPELTEGKCSSPSNL